MIMPPGYGSGPQDERARLAMMRRRRARHRDTPQGSIAGQTKSEINVTPLVDVVLVLLIIFMVVTPLLHRGVAIELPETKHHARKQDTGGQLVVSIRDDGTYIDAEPIAEAAMLGRFRRELRSPGRAVHIRADRSLQYGQVRAVLEVLHDAGAGVIGMGSEERR